MSKTITFDNLHILNNIPQIEIHDIKTHRDSILLIDVREQEEWDQGHIDGAVLHPLSEIAKGNLPDLDTNKTIVLHCQKGGRSQQAAEFINAKTGKDVLNMVGGYSVWSQDD